MKRAEELRTSFFNSETDRWSNIGQEKMPWLQAISAEAFKEHGLRRSFGFDYIPHLVVIGKDGRIAANLNFYKKEQLQQVLKKLN